MFRIAIYGKGGIGKSTTSSNLSFCLARRGLSVMQIGCDPKHDSTRQLLGGGKQTTVLDYVRATPPSERRLDDIVEIGAGGVACIEAGGPEPGVGCAGRGILTTFDTLERLGMDRLDADVAVYDVLGDVVCGGFAVPMRAEHTDAIYIVTSGEFMSIYAANNILRGLLNFGADPPRVAGLVFNERGFPGERGRAEAFSSATGIPIVVSIPRSGEFMEAEKAGSTVSELFPESEAASLYRFLADDVASVSEGRRPLHAPRPLDDDALDCILAGRPVPTRPGIQREAACAGSTFFGMGSCASRGAVFEAGRVTDLPILVHGPDSCGYVMSHTQDSHYLSDIGSDPFLVPKMRNNVRCTGMDGSSSVFGGADDLERSLRSLMEAGHRDVMVVTTCVSGMIGDDVDRVASRVADDHPGCSVDVIHADGNLSGDSEEGREAVADALMSRIDPSVDPVGDGVNIIDDTFIWFNRGLNRHWTEELLGLMGLRTGVLLFEDCSLEDIRTCRRNPHASLAEDGGRNRAMAGKLASRGVAADLPPLPKGFAETAAWCREAGRILGRADAAEDAVASMAAGYEADLECARRFLEGKRVDFAVGSMTDFDWMVDALLDAGAEVGAVEVMRMRSSERRVSRHAGRVEIRDMSAGCGSCRGENRGSPDLVIGRRMGRGSPAPVMGIPVDVIGHRASGAFLRAAAGILMTGGREGWRSWGDGQ